MNTEALQEFSLTPIDFGWSGSFSADHRFFGHQIRLEVHTRLTPDGPKLLPPVSSKQAELVRKISENLTKLIPLLEREFTTFNQGFDADFQRFIRRPHVWLSAKTEDDLAWTFVVERTDNPDFGYHADFRATDLIELWAGD
jgi:hypothetical protein